MHSKAYRWCSVPLCTNTSIKTPEKLFIFVPFNKTIRNKWLKLARRHLKGISPTTQLYFCEDHFDLPNDMENYMEYHVMGSVSQIHMKRGCVPLKFECQPDRRKRTSDSNERQYIAKKQRREVIEEFEQELQKITTTTTATEQLELEDPSPGTSAMQDNITQDAPKMANKSIQVTNTEKILKCNSCQADINGFRYVCVQCTDFDMCGDCVTRGHHAAHYVLRVPSPRPQNEINSVVETIRNQLKALENDVAELKFASINQLTSDYDVKQEHPVYSPDVDPFAQTSMENIVPTINKPQDYDSTDQSITTSDFYIKREPPDEGETQSGSTSEQNREQTVVNTDLGADQILLTIENQEIKDIPRKKRKADIPEISLGHIVQCIKIIRKKS